MWEVSIESIDTRTKLRMIFPNREDSCSLYDSEKETIHHLLLGCQESLLIWLEVCKYLNIQLNL